MRDSTDIATILGTIFSGVLGVVTWVSGMQIVTAPLSAVTGAFLIVYFNRRIQKKAWAREITIKKMDEVFGPLFLDVENALLKFASADDLGYNWYRSEEWPKIKAHYHYRILHSTDKDLTNKLENFYALIDQVNHLNSEVIDLAGRTLLKHVMEKMGADIENVSWRFAGFRDGRSQGDLSFLELRPVLIGKDPIEMLMSDYTRNDTIQTKIGLQRRGSNEVLYQDIDLQTTREIFAKASKEVSENPKMKSLKQETIRLRNLGEEIRDRLGKMIDEPWKV